MAVVKADGFGHGATAVARTALANGASRIGVTSLQEALSLRADGLAASLLSWLNPVDADFGAAVSHQVEVAVPGVEHLAAVVAAARVPALVQLHVDVGMARDGCSPAEWGTLCAAARAAEQAGHVAVVGVMGHLGWANEPRDPLNG